MTVQRIYRVLFLLLPLLLLPLFLLGCKGSSDTIIVIETFVNPYSGSDTYLSLFDAAGNLLAEDDDSSPDQVNHAGCSRIVINGGLSNGTYYIKVENRTSTGNPNYGIQVIDYDPGSTVPSTSTTTNEDDGNSDDGIDGFGVDDGIPTNPVTINVGDVQARAIFPAGADDDWFVLALP